MKRSLTLLLWISMILGATCAFASEASELRNELGIIHARDGHLEDALRQFSMILANEPESAVALNNSANVYFMQGDHEQAKQLYGQAHLEAPEVGGILLNLGILEHLLGDEDSSRRHIRDGMALVGDLDTAYYLLGLSKSAGSERASDESGVREVEIEALLAEAMAGIPEAEAELEATPQEQAVAQEQTVSTRAGATKAAEIDTKVERLFWMTSEETP